MSAIRSLTRLVLHSFVLTAIAVRCEAQAKGPEEPLKRALMGGIDLFAAVQSSWHEKIIEPLARTQARQALGRLSLALDSLAIQKEELGEAIVAAKASNHFDSLAGRALALSQRVSDVRAALPEVFSYLPSDKRAAGDTVTNGLYLAFSSKLESLEAIRSYLGTPDTSTAAIRTQTREIAQLTRHMKLQVDSAAASLRTK